MSNKRIIIIISAVIIFFISAVLVFFLAKIAGDKSVKQPDTSLSGGLKSKKQENYRHLCHDLEHLDKTKYKECINNVLRKAAKQEVNQCEPLGEGDNYYDCLRGVFDVYNEKSDCADLADLGALTICQDIFNYQAAYAKYDRALCQAVKNKKLNQYCLRNIVDKK